MDIYDISMPISHNMPVYNGKSAKRPVITVDGDFTTGAVYESRINMNLHTGTHIDTPLHLLPGGGTIEALALKRVVRKCKVLDLQAVQEGITGEHLASKPIAPGDFVLLKTRNSFEHILEDQFVYLEKSGALLLKDRCISGVGIDALGIERGQIGHETHKILLGADIVILEGLRLGDVPEGEYLLVAAPLFIGGVEAAPVRALLIGI